MIHSGVLDVDFLAKERTLIPQALILHRQPHAATDMASSHSADMDDRKMGKGNRMQDR
jgi:hypothetical protein